MYCGIFIIVIVIPSPSLGLVDCLTACTRCRDHDEEYPRVLEVYCAMCQECNDRRREQRLKGHPTTEQLIYSLESNAEDCPTPPPCDTDIEDIPPYTLAHTLRATSTTPSTTTTTTRRPCPPVTGCKRIQKSTPRCYYPCLPACPCPYPQLYTTPAPRKLALSPTTSKNTGYLYVYVGVPKDILHKTNR